LLRLILLLCLTKSGSSCTFFSLYSLIFTVAPNCMNTFAFKHFPYANMITKQDEFCSRRELRAFICFPIAKARFYFSAAPDKILHSRRASGRVSRSHGGHLRGKRCYKPTAFANKFANKFTTCSETGLQLNFIALYSSAAATAVARSTLAN